MKGTLIILALALVALVAGQTIHSDPARSEFIAFQHRYGKIYATAADFEYRFKVFKANMLKASELSARDPHAQYGITKFSDMTPEEFKKTILMPEIPPLKSRAEPNFTQAALEVNDALPQQTTFDWRNTAGVVTPVYNQGQCGSCWAFSITENIESQWALSGHSLQSLSMQQVVSCDTGDNGCGGGYPTTAYSYVQSEGGLESYSTYPYESGTGESGSCQFNSQAVVATISSYTSIGSENQAQSYLRSHGPLSVCVDASSWQYYNGGIITTSSECGESIDHCVGITGYGVSGEGVNYWWVRNSWGSDWGQGGYLQVESGADVCGIGQVITSSIV